MKPKAQSSLTYRLLYIKQLMILKSVFLLKNATSIHLRIILILTYCTTCIITRYPEHNIHKVKGFSMYTYTLKYLNYLLIQIIIVVYNIHTF